MSADVLRTAWAALLVITISGNFPDEEDRQEMAGAAMVAEHLQDLGELSPHQIGLALEALLLVFREAAPGPGRIQDGQLAALLTTERVALAYLTLSELADRQAGESYDLHEAMLASVALSLWRLEATVVMTPELHEQRRELTLLRDTLEGALHTGCPLDLTPADAYTLRQSVIGSISDLSTRPQLVDRLQVPPDLRVALTTERLHAVYHHLISLERDVAAVA